YRAHGVGDLADGGLRFHGGDDAGYEVAAVPGCGADLFQRRRRCRRAPAGADHAHALDLPRFDGRIDRERLDRRTVGIGREAVHADDRVGSRIDGLLRAVRRFLDLALNQSAFDCRQRAAGVVDAIENLPRAALDVVGQRLDRVRPGDRVDGVRDA